MAADRRGGVARPAGGPGAAGPALGLGAVQRRVRTDQRQLPGEQRRRAGLDRCRRRAAGRAGEHARPGTGTRRARGVDLPRPGLGGVGADHHDGAAGARTGGRSVRHDTRDLRPHPGGRGPRRQPDAVADAAPARRQRELDDRRRPGAELLARRGRGRPGLARHHRFRAGTPVPAGHQLPKPGRGVRPGLAGCRLRSSRTRTCRWPYERPASSPSCAPRRATG